MSQENVEIVRAICAAWERGDFTAAEWAHPEIEYEIPDGPAPGRWSGLAGMAEGWGSWVNAFEDFRGVAVDIRDLEDDRVLAFVQFSGRGRASGLDVGRTQSKGANLFYLRDGRVTKLITYVDHEHALEAVGLSE